MVVDPDGRDEYELNKETGKISHLNDNKHYIDGPNGTKTEVDKLFNQEGNSINVSKGVLNQKQLKEDQFQFFAFSNAEEAEQFYYFAAKNSDAEYAFAKTNSEYSYEYSYVGTDYSSSSTTMTYRFEEAYGSSITLMSHSHPLGGYPSVDLLVKTKNGYTRAGDLNSAQESNYNFQREVYAVPEGKIYGYDNSTLKRDRYNNVQDIEQRKNNLKQRR